MKKRIRQFFRAVFAHLEEKDYNYLGKHLSDKERRLFFSMHRADQYHALQVAYTAERLADRCLEPVDRELLLRAALLHDVGRQKGDMDIWGKVFAVGMEKFFPEGSRKWAEENRSLLWKRPVHALKIYYHHPEIGAEKLLRMGLLREAEMAGGHHSPEKIGDTIELRLLRQADEMN